MNRSIEDMERELAKSSWRPRPEDDSLVIIGELLAGIEDAKQKMDANIKRKVEKKEPHQRKSCRRAKRRRSKSLGGQPPLPLILDGVPCKCLYSI